MSKMNEKVWPLLHMFVVQAEQQHQMTELWRRMDDLERVQEQQLEELAPVSAEQIPSAQQGLWQVPAVWENMLVWQTTSLWLEGRSFAGRSWPSSRSRVTTLGGSGWRLNSALELSGLDGSPARTYNIWTDSKTFKDPRIHPPQDVFHKAIIKYMISNIK